VAKSPIANLVLHAGACRPQVKWPSSPRSKTLLNRLLEERRRHARRFSAYHIRPCLHAIVLSHESTAFPHRPIGGRVAPRLAHFTRKESQRRTSLISALDSELTIALVWCTPGCCTAASSAAFAWLVVPAYPGRYAYGRAPAYWQWLLVPRECCLRYSCLRCPLGSLCSTQVGA